MACPIEGCGKRACTHTPAERGQTVREVRADKKYGSDPDEGPLSAREREQRAWDALAEFGRAGMSTAIALVGQEIADGHLQKTREERKEDRQSRR